MADKRIYELVTSGVRTGKYFIMDSNALTDAEKFDATLLLSEVDADAKYQLLSDVPLAPVAKLGPYRSTSTAETLVLAHSGITDAIYEGKLAERVVRGVINYHIVQNGATTPSVVFRVKKDTTTILTTTTISGSSLIGRVVFEVGALNTINSYVKYLNIYNATVQDQSSQSDTSVSHGTGNGIGLYIDGAGDIQWTIESATIEMIG